MCTATVISFKLLYTQAAIFRRKQLTDVTPLSLGTRDERKSPYGLNPKMQAERILETPLNVTRSSNNYEV